MKKLWERHHIGICDQIWFGRSVIMDKFIKLFEWIQQKIDILFFVNESVLFKFIRENDIRIKCVEMKYVLRREFLLHANNSQIMIEYLQQNTLPWVKECPIKVDTVYPQYINDKNESATNIYFLTKQLYTDVPCKLLNVLTNKYIYTPNQIYGTGTTGSNNCTYFKIHIYNSYLINILVEYPTITHNKAICLTINDQQLICTTDIDNPKTHFFLLKRGSYYCFVHYIFQEDRYLYMNNISNTFNILTNGSKNTPGIEWSIIST